MGKMVIITDEVKCCLKCQFCIKDIEFPQCKIDQALGNNRNTSWEKLDTIPEWCPLRSLPEELGDSNGYNAGWNDCLKRILKSIDGREYGEKKNSNSRTREKY